MPKAEALLRSVDAMDNESDEKTAAASTKVAKSSTTEEPSSMNSVDHEFDTEDADGDETADLNRVNVKVPLELNLSELAHSILQSQQK